MIRVVMARRYARTIHWTSWKVAPNDSAMVGRPTLAMLVERRQQHRQREADQYPYV
jgi:hypothetical protein